MDIFESLENLNVSEECFEDIVGLVEELLSENTVSYAKKKKGEAQETLDKFHNDNIDYIKKVQDNHNHSDKPIPDKYRNIDKVYRALQKRVSKAQELVQKAEDSYKKGQEQKQPYPHKTPGGSKYVPDKVSSYGGCKQCSGKGHDITKNEAGMKAKFSRDLDRGIKGGAGSGGDEWYKNYILNEPNRNLKDYLKKTSDSLHPVHND